MFLKSSSTGKNATYPKELIQHGSFLLQIHRLYSMHLFPNIRQNPQTVHTDMFSLSFDRKYFILVL